MPTIKTQYFKTNFLNSSVVPGHMPGLRMNFFLSCFKHKDLAKRQTKNVKQNQRNRFDKPSTSAFHTAICRLQGVKTWLNEDLMTAFRNRKGHPFDMKKPSKRAERTAISRHSSRSCAVFGRPVLHIPAIKACSILTHRCLRLHTSAYVIFGQVDNYSGITLL